LAAQNKEIKNYNVAVEETNGDIVFLHKVVPGPANGSYGVHVAALAGIPKQIIDRANQLLETMENPENLMGKEQIPLL
jgi:DNA mismatch repair protein MutS